jgi:hypothetical protein
MFDELDTKEVRDGGQLAEATRSRRWSDGGDGLKFDESEFGCDTIVRPRTAKWTANPNVACGLYILLKRQ